MKRLILVLLFAAHLTAWSDAEEREFARKSVVKEFPNASEAGRWRLDSLPFKDWLQAVTFPDCKLLHSSETENFYFAAFRNGVHLIFWVADRKDRYKSSTVEVTAGSRSAKSEQEPSKWVVLDYSLMFPGGALGGQSLGTVLRIKEGLRGDVTLLYRVGADKAAKEVFEQAIPWTK